METYTLSEVATQTKIPKKMFYKNYIRRKYPVMFISIMYVINIKQNINKNINKAQFYVAVLHVKSIYKKEK